MIILGIVIGVIFGIIIGACIAKADTSNENINTEVTTSQVEKPKYIPIEKPTSAQLEKLTQTQIKNEMLKYNILMEMETGRAYLVSEMIKELACCEKCTNQKISALMRQLFVEEKIDRFEDNGKVYYALA